jgi:AmiR/NasT family two-component response regulator
VSVQLHVSLSEAFVRIRAHAFAGSTPMREVAQDIIAGRLSLGDPESAT